MRFRAEHRFDGPVGEVVAVLADPDFYLGLDLPDLGEPELLEHTDGDEVLVRLRYEYVGSLDPMARRLLGSGQLTWAQEVRLDRSTGAGRLAFEAERQPRLLHGSARFTLSEADDGSGGSVRRLDGELVVGLPGVGRMAERRIVPGIERRLGIEAEAVNERLHAGGVER